MSSEKYLDMPNGSKSDGKKIMQMSFVGDVNQMWQIIPTTDGSFFIKSECSGKYLEVPRIYYFYDCNDVNQWEYTGNENQKWAFVKNADSSYFIVSKLSGKYLDLPWDSKKDSVTIAQFQGHKKINQRWFLRPISNKRIAIKVKSFPYSGLKIMSTYHKNGQLAEKYQLSKGKLDGPYIKFYENGDTLLTGNFADDELNEKFITYYKGNKIKSIKEYYKDIEITIWQYKDDSLTYHAERIFKNKTPSSKWRIYNAYNKLIGENEMDLSEIMQIGKNIFISEHFVYFSSGMNRIRELEKNYKMLTGCTLVPFEENLMPIYCKKIKYHAEVEEGVFTRAWEPAIYDKCDNAFCHEIVHTLLWEYRNMGPFSEGMAQCFGLDFTKPNVNLSVQKLLFEKESYYSCNPNKMINDGISVVNTIKNWKSHSNYNVMASFVYFSFFVLEDTDRNNFIKFLKCPKKNFDNLIDFFSCYESFMGRSIEEVDKEWIKWLWGITKNSKIYSDSHCNELVQ